MTAWKRWQDWATVLLGVIAVATPFVFGIDLASTPAWTAYVMGILLVLGGLWAASTPEPNTAIEWVPLVLGAVLFVAPWVLSFTSVGTMAWMSWIIGGLAVVNGGGELLFGQKPSAGEAPTAGQKPKAA